MRLLLVEDNELLRECLRDHLLQKKPELVIVEASNGRQALEILEYERFDLIVTDFNMPTMNGEEFVKNARERGVKNAIYMWSSEILERRIEGIDRFFKKVVEDKSLISIILERAA